MLSSDILDAQIAIALPQRELLKRWSITVIVPVVIQNQINVQICGGNCTNVQWSFSGIDLGD